MKRIALFVHKHLSKPTIRMVSFCVVVIVLLTDFLLMVEINAREFLQTSREHGVEVVQAEEGGVPDNQEGITEEELKILREHLEAITINQYPSAAFYRLQKVKKEKKLDDETCFALTKLIGEKSFGKYKNLSRALQYKDPMCQNGYIIGAIAGYVSSSPNVFVDAQDVCAKVTPDEWPVCYQAVGSGFLAYNRGDDILSRAMCEIFMSDDAVMNCIRGVGQL